MTYIKPLSREEQAHCRRTAALSELLAKLAGLPDSEVRTVTQSALVHDIGKTAIPPAILGKTGPLTEEEHAIMRMHTAIGAHILIHTHGAMRTASAGHTATQWPQPMHCPSFRRALPPSTVSSPRRQSLAHSPQPTHLSASTVTL